MVTEPLAPPISPVTVTLVTPFVIVMTQGDSPFVSAIGNQGDWHVYHKIISIVVFWTFMPMFL